MEKRYQVFVSSTFIDLREERDTAVKTIMGLDCIPAGMELFPAADIEQFEYIKKIIDECDYYLLIIGGKYGSVTEEGVSFTEMEYEYAVSQGKSVMAFLHQTPEELPVNKSEVTEEAIFKLQAFRNRVSSGRLVEFWENKDQLAGKIALTLPKTIKLFPAVGWVKADIPASNKMLEEVNQLRIENKKLRSQLDNLNAIQKFDVSELALLSDYIAIKGSYSINTSKGFMPDGERDFEIEFKIGDVFQKLALRIETSHTSINEKHCIEIIKQFIQKKVKSDYSDYHRGAFSTLTYNEDIIFRFKHHFISLGLISAKVSKAQDNNYYTFWSLTSQGRDKLTEQLSFKLIEMPNAL